LRPQSIIRFEQFYVAICLITVLEQILTFLGLSGPDEARDLSPVVVGFIVAVTYGILFLFWYLIVWRASNVAKWVLVVMTGLGLLGTIPIITTQAVSHPLYAGFTAVITGLQLIAIVFLFRRDAAEWLRSRGQIGVIDISAFD
jgi:hypothetical protein